MKVPCVHIPSPGCENCSREDCRRLGDKGRNIFGEIPPRKPRSFRSSRASPKMSCEDRSKNEGFPWQRMTSRKNATLGRREGFRKERYPTVEEFEQYMEDKYLSSRQPRTPTTPERFDKTLRDRGRRTDCEDCGRYDNINSCSRCRQYNDETSYILGKQAALVETVGFVGRELVRLARSGAGEKGCHPDGGQPLELELEEVAQELDRTEAGRRDDYEQADRDPIEEYLAWRKAAFPDDEVCSGDEVAPSSADRPRTPHKPEGVRASSARGVRWRTPLAGEETRDMGTRDKVETRRQAVPTRNDREAGASTPRRPGGPRRVPPTHDDEPERELITIGSSPENSPEKRDSPRPSPREGRRSRPQVAVLNAGLQAVASGMEDQQPRAGPSKAGEQRDAPRESLPVLGVGPAEATPERPQEAQASAPPPRSSWPCDHCRGTEDEPLCRLHSTLGSKEPNFCNRRLFKCPVKGTVALVFVEGDTH